MNVDQEQLEMRIVSLLSNIRNKKWHPEPEKRVGALLGFPFDLDNEEHAKRVVSAMKGVDYFDGREIYVLSNEFTYALEACMGGDSHDGAILIDENGMVIQNDSGLVIDISSIAKEMRERYGIVDRNCSYYKQLGFREVVGGRHCAAKGISHELGIKMVTLSQTTGTIRVFDKGYTIKVFTASPELNPYVNPDVYKEIEKVPNDHKIVAPKRKHRYISIRQARRVG